MRILQLCSAPTLGGGEVHVIELIDLLRRNGHDVTVVGRSGGPLELDLALPLANAVDVYSSYRLRRLVSRRRIEIVHAHLARDYPIAALALTGIEGPGLVLTRQLIHRVRPNPLYSRVDGWIVTTEQIERSISHLKPRAVRVIPNWVDTGKFPFREHPLSEPVVIGLLAQISPHKGHDDAIAAMRELGRGFKLLVAGRGERDYVESLEHGARDLPVEFVGFVKPETFLYTIDMLILPSWEEPFGIVVLEAMAAGVPVIATDSGGPPLILDGGRSGLLVPPRNPAALAAAIRRLASDPELQSELRERARKRVLELYDIHEVVPRIVDFYATLVH